MKFSKIITTFKNGLVSPLLRGRTDVQGIESGAEEFFNFYVDSTGSSRRRPPLRDAGNPHSANEKIAHTAGQPHNIQSFGFTILGQDFVFSFDKNQFFNAVGTANSLLTDPLRGSKYLRIHSASGTTPTVYPVQVFGQATDFSAAAFKRLEAWNTTGTNSGTSTTGLNHYLSRTLDIVQFTQVSDRTVVFTTKAGFPFCVSLVTLKSENSDSDAQIQNSFIMYPYFVNLSILSRQSVGLLEYQCPIAPINYPFNARNSDTSAKVIVERVAPGTNQPSSGLMYTNAMGYLHVVKIPQKIHNNDYTYFEGAFVRVTTQDSKEAVYFLTQQDGTQTVSGVIYRRYLAIGCVGGDPLPAGTSSFVISSWNDALGFPRITTTYKARLMFGNAGLNPEEHIWGGDNSNTVWAAAINKNSIFDYQGMMADTLIQDIGTSDVSGLLYYNSTNTAQRGFGLAFADGEGEEMRWMMPRRRLHLGTTKGEYQITVTATFDRDSADQSKIGTISSDYIQPVGGDRKIIYCANDGQELRYISVEDRDYESVDGKLNATLAGLDITIQKIVWFERMRVLLILTTDYQVYALSLDSLLQINAFSKWTFSVDVVDICATGSYAFITYFDAAYGGYKYAQFNLDDPATRNIHLDFGTTPYKSRVRSMPIEGGSQFGSAVGDITRIDRATIQVFDSGNFYYGSEDGHLYKTENLPDDGSVITKNYSLQLPQSPDVEVFVIIETEADTPLNISGIAVRGVSYQGE